MIRRWWRKRQLRETIRHEDEAHLQALRAFLRKTYGQDPPPRWPRWLKNIERELKSSAEIFVETVFDMLGTQLEEATREGWDAGFRKAMQKHREARIQCLDHDKQEFLKKYPPRS